MSTGQWHIVCVHLIADPQQPWVEVSGGDWLCEKCAQTDDINQLVDLEPLSQESIDGLRGQRQ